MLRVFVHFRNWRVQNLPVPTHTYLAIVLRMCVTYAFAAKHFRCAICTLWEIVFGVNAELKLLLIMNFQWNFNFTQSNNCVFFQCINYLAHLLVTSHVKYND